VFVFLIYWVVNVMSCPRCDVDDGFLLKMNTVEVLLLLVEVNVAIFVLFLS